MKKCPNCGAEVSDNAKFCFQCGAKIPDEIFCPHCGTSLPPNAKFCLTCGGAVNVGNTDAQTSLDSAIELYGDEQYSRAIPMFSRLADQEPAAKKYLAYCYLYGHGIKEDIPKALELLQQAAVDGCNDVLSDIACIYMDDDYGLKDISKGIQYFKEAARYNDNCALSNLAEIYAVGYHVNEDWDKSYEYLSGLDDLGVIEKSLLALMYWDGKGVKQDKDKAFRLLEETGGEDLPISFEYDKEIIIKACLLNAAIHCENLTGSGNFEFGIEIYRFLSSEYNCKEAEEKLEAYRNEGSSVIHKYGDTYKSCNGCVYDETGSILTDVQPSFTIDDLPLSQVYGKNHEAEIIIPEGICEIGEEAFYGCEHLERIVLPSTLRKIGEGAFKGCSSMAEANIPEGVESIGEGAFFGCEHLEGLVLPLSLNKISEAFQREKMLNELKGEIPYIEPTKLNLHAKIEAFEFLTKNTDLVVSIDNFVLIASIFQECDNEFSLTSDQTEAIVTQQMEIYKDARKHTEITLPSDLTYIKSSLFSKSGIESISIPESLKIIRKDTFKDCSSLKTVQIPSCGLTKIEVGAFYGTTMLKTINLPSSLKSISDHAFSKSGLESICIPESIENISRYAFEECTSLKEVSVLCPINLLKEWTFDYPLSHFSIGICNEPENTVNLPCSESYYIRDFSPEIGQAIVLATNGTADPQDCKVFVPYGYLEEATDFFKERMARNIIPLSDNNIIIDDHEALFYTENIEDEQISIGEILDEELRERQAEEDAYESCRESIDPADRIAESIVSSIIARRTRRPNFEAVVAASAGIIGSGLSALGKGISKVAKSSHDSSQSNKTSSPKRRERPHGTVLYKEITITHDDFISGKYRSTGLYPGGRYTAKILLVGGSIDPDATYTDRYCRQHKLGKYSD